ncbi:sugar transferase [Cohnella yongneupensis]|uniref:Sugar transferase n=1 Tax=Cohnella yongneupensis TaxID=425006 RepID=A0ABW0R431_9BACL
MRISELANQQVYPHRVRTVGTVAKERLTKKRSLVFLGRWFIAMEYVGYVVTFYLLMAAKVLQDYPQINRFNPIEWSREISVFTDYAIFLLIFLVIHAFAIVQNQLFSGKAERSFFEQYRLSFRSLVYAFLITLGITFLLKTTFLYSRVTLVTFLVMVMLESLILLGVKGVIINKRYRAGVVKQQVLIVGAGRVGTKLQEQLSQSADLKHDVIGYLDDRKQGKDILGKTSELERIIQQQHIDTIYITIPSERHIIESMLHTVYKYDVDIRIIPEMFDRMATVFAFRSDLELPCLQIVKTPLRGINVFLKRVADIVGSFLLLLLTSPLLLVLSIWIKLDSKGEVFFKQSRVGKNGIPFQMLKFRSMQQGAEWEQRALFKANEASGPVFKMRNDPRVTRIGAWLRRYSLDELPQLWNVLKGEMSLIGPRPPLPSEVAQYTDYHWRRMDVLPGMTGLWQVSGRSDLDFEDWIDLDIYYIERWSFALEMKILIKTIPAVIKGSGAY